MTAVVIVPGGSGCLGRAVVAAALDAGHGVIAAARGAAALDALGRRHPGRDLQLLPADFGTDAGAQAFACAVRATGRPVHGVVATLAGKAQRGRLLDQPGETLRRRFDEDVLPHLFAARHLLPLTAGQPPGGYVLVGGPGAEHPWAGYGHRSVGASALRMLARALHEEAAQMGVRAQLLSVDSPARCEHNARHACAQWPEADAVARAALALLDRIDATAEPVVRYRAGTDAPQSMRTPAPARGRAHAQGTDRGAPADPQRCLSDARALLRALSPRTAPQESPR